ncbi:hypothetical protein LOD99_13272 [Oopsacas minuta]|uniref:Uncharacterized protein n=1 Tax=Oopsacas minuta TaxID=111878 RepID=A0AAV7KIZ7_9METZ|nr:hypothetical protein LOD99_13272 [Oopsacas minuta]
MACGEKSLTHSTKICRDESSPQIFAKNHKAVLAFGIGGVENGELSRARSIAYREETQEYFITDQANSRIQIFNSHGKFVHTFGNNDLILPSYLVLHEQFLFVTDWGWLGYSLFKYEISSLQMVKRIGKNGFDPLIDYNVLRKPAIAPNYNLYVPDNNNNRICIFTQNLEFVQDIKSTGLISPVDITFHKEHMYVLTNFGTHCVHIFNFNGEIIESILTRSELDCGMQVRFPSSFLIASDSNIIISDLVDHSIKIFDPTAKFLLYKIGGEGNEFGYFFYPKGIFLTSKGELIVISMNERYGVQIFEFV